MTGWARPPHPEEWLAGPPVKALMPPRLGEERAGAVARADAWPYTPRLLPWAIAGFLVLIWLTPVDAITLPDVPLPVEATIDRVAFVVVAGLWLAWILVGRAKGNLRARFTGIDVAVGALLLVSLVSVVLNAKTLLVVDEFELSTKKLAILVSFVLLYVVVVSGLRASELGAFQTLVVILAAISALGVIYEYRTGINVFYDWSARFLPGVFSVEQPPSDPEFGRELVTGPTAHAIAMATVLAMALPFAFTSYMRSTTTRNRVLYGLAITLILAGCIATVRRTGALGPVTALVALIIYRPRQMMRLLPLGLVVIVATQGLAPNAISRVKAQFADIAGDNSVTGRTNDYNPVRADVRHGLLIGRGYGSYDPAQHRFLDNEWLGRVIETGVIGALAYLLVILAMMRVAHRAGRSRDPISRGVGISVVAAVGVYAVTNGVFDALAFPQAPYMLFFVGALGVIALHTRGEEATADSPETPARTRPALALWRELQPLPVIGTTQPDLSVVIVTHNGRQQALTTLRSARRAAGTAWIEWLVVDCGSVDGTPDAIEAAFADVVVYREDNLGFAAGNNVALADARGRYVLLLNPDVEISTGRLSDLVTELDERPGVGASSVVQRSPAGRLLPSIGRFPSTARQFGEALALARILGVGHLQEMEARPSAYEGETEADWLVGAFLMVRAEAIADVGVLDERFFLYSEEKDWCYRIRQAGWDVRHLPVMEIIHHTGGYDGAGRLAQLTHSKLLFAEKHCGPLERAGIRAGLVLRHAIRMALLSLSPLGRHRRRARHEAQAYSVALGRTRPPGNDCAGPTA